ncbi:MAG: hypothetical protein Q9179_007631, partial [Wetmoreana sp. 5 TL-2023]
IKRSWPSMATCAFWNLDLRETVKPSQQPVMDQIKHAERKIFPRNEAFDFDSELKKRNTELIVVLDRVELSGDPALVAYAVYVHTSKASLLQKLCVLEPYRRKGIARRMLQQQHEKLALRGRRNVQLWVDEERLPAKQLYSSIGFEEVGRLEDYYGPRRTALRMVLDLYSFG